jgi:hypothetical protein
VKTEPDSRQRPLRFVEDMDDGDRMVNGAKQSRRGILGLAAAALAGVAGAAIGSKDASGANGAGLLVGQADNTASSPTKLTTAGPQIADDGAFVVEGTNADYGVIGSGTNVGVYGKGTIGVFGEGTVGGVFSGTAAAISLTPLNVNGPPTTASLKGDIAVDVDGVLWFCGATGTPGTWIRVLSGSVQMLDSPQRAYDSRNAQGAIAGGSSRTIAIVGANDDEGNPLKVPAAAVGIVCNITVTETSSGGYLTAFPTGTARPRPSNLNWSQGWTIANSATIKLGTGGKINVYVEASDAQVILDVTGYVL